MERTTLEILKAFCEGYTRALDAERAFRSDTLRRVDDWFEWGGYDLNLFGADLDASLTPTQLRVCAYPAGWEGSLPEPLHDFVVGETQ